MQEVDIYVIMVSTKTPSEQYDWKDLGWKPVSCFLTEAGALQDAQRLRGLRDMEGTDDIYIQILKRKFEVKVG